MTKDEKKKYIDTILGDLKAGCDTMIDMGIDMKISEDGSPLETFTVVLTEYLMLIANAQFKNKKPVQEQKPKELISSEKQKAWEGFVQEDESEPVKRTMH